MNWVGGLILGIPIGAMFGVATMSIMFAASKADDTLLKDAQYNED